MKVDTYLFGSVDVNPEKVVDFPNGLVGFEEKKRFMLVHEEGQANPTCFTLQSLDDPMLAFQIVDPTALGFNYELALNDVENALLQSPAAEDVVVMQMLYKNDGEDKTGIVPNLRAPLIINTRARVGVQKIMETMNSNVTLSNLSNPV